VMPHATAIVRPITPAIVAPVAPIPAAPVICRLPIIARRHARQCPPRRRIPIAAMIVSIRSMSVIVTRPMMVRIVSLRNTMHEALISTCYDWH
jgi:hypothetical protein